MEDTEVPVQEKIEVKVVVVKKDDLDGLDGNEPVVEEKKEEEVVDPGNL